MEVLEVLAGTRRWWVVEGEALATLALLPSGCADAFVTDPPYSSGGFTRGDRTGDAAAKYSKAKLVPQAAFGGDNRDQRAFEWWCAMWLHQALRVTVDGGPLVQFTDWRQLPSTTDAIQAGGWLWRGIVPWVKPGNTVRPQVGRFSSGAEFGVWGTKGAALDLAEVGCLPGWLECPAPTGDARIHLTQKPDPVMRWTVGICRPGGLVIDPFAGSGTTGVACLATGRRCLMIEEDPANAQKVRDRMRVEETNLPLRAVRESHAGQLAMFGGETK